MKNANLVRGLNAFVAGLLIFIFGLPFGAAILYYACPAIFSEPIGLFVIGAVIILIIGIPAIIKSQK